MDFPIYPPPLIWTPPFIRFSENFPPPYYLDPPFIRHQRVTSMLLQKIFGKKWRLGYSTYISTKYVEKSKEHVDLYFT